MSIPFLNFLSKIPYSIIDRISLPNERKKTAALILTAVSAHYGTNNHDLSTPNFKPPPIE